MSRKKILQQVKRCICFLCIVFCVFTFFYYPQQQAKICMIKKLDVQTPQKNKYKNDCLHPCVRYVHIPFAGYHYWMVQSPYYGWNNKIENPILYRSNSIDSLGMNGLLLADTPLTGHYSDPNLFIDDDSVLYVFWRECGTPLCSKVKHSPITVGISSKDGLTFSEKKIYLMNDYSNGDIEQSPILLKRDDEYLFYSVWYQYIPERKNRGVAIWKSSSLSNPNFVLVDTIPLKCKYTCDKAAEIRIGGYRLYCPKAQSFDLWHFDLFEKKNGNLGVIACAEKGDVIMLGESEDWVHIEFNRKPLVVNHFMENSLGYRQYYYKPTVCIDSVGTHYFWTSNDSNDVNRNVLWHLEEEQIPNNN